MSAGTNRLASVGTGAGQRAIAYDGRGNTASETRPGAVGVTASYDGHGRLTGYARTGDPTQTNVYNGLDDRVAVTSGAVTTRFLYGNDGRVLAEYGASATDVIAEHIWWQPEVANDNPFVGGKPAPAQAGDGIGGYAPIAVVNGAVLSWVHGSHMGVPIVYADATGTAGTPPAYTLPGYPGQLRTFADLYYNRYRDYDPSIGRYVQADPIGLGGGANDYLYAGANPQRWSDPFGLQTGPGIGHNSGDPTPLDRRDMPPAAWNIIRRLLRIGAIPGVIVGDVFFPEPLGDGTYVPKPCSPAQSTVWKRLKKFRGSIKQDGEGHYYSFDRLHGEIEVFNSRGVHVGAINPMSGEPTKPAVPGRKIGL